MQSYNSQVKDLYFMSNLTLIFCNLTCNLITVNHTRFDVHIFCIFSVKRPVNSFSTWHGKDWCMGMAHPFNVPFSAFEKTGHSLEFSSASLREDLVGARTVLLSIPVDAALS